MSTHTVVVQVTKEHIEKGQTRGLGPRSTTCPVARAVLDAVQPLFQGRRLEVGVSSRHVSVRDADEWKHLANADLPEEAIQRIAQFDSATNLTAEPGEAGEPFSFTLELHTHVLVSAS